MSEPGRTGLFITLEGPEGSGKSTQLVSLQRALEERGIPVAATREPGGVAGAERIREIVVNDHFVPRAEALLFLAARAQHTEQVIRPALQQGRVVLCDRYHDSTLAYQGYGLGLDVEELRRLCLFASGGLAPDLTLLFDVPVKVGLDRRRGWINQPQLGLDIATAAEEAATTGIDDRPISFHERVRVGFLVEAKRDPRRIRVLNGTRSPEAVHAEALKLALGALGLPATRAGPRSRGAR